MTIIHVSLCTSFSLFFCFSLFSPGPFCALSPSHHFLLIYSFFFHFTLLSKRSMKSISLILNSVLFVPGPFVFFILRFNLFEFLFFHIDFRLREWSLHVSPCFQSLLCRQNWLHSRSRHAKKVVMEPPDSVFRDKRRVS